MLNHRNPSLLFPFAVRILVAGYLAQDKRPVFALYSDTLFCAVWDKRMARNQFKWLWLHTPTYASYKVEGISVPLLLAAGAATKSARSAILVLRSLTPNAQSVFRVLAEFQIGHPEDQGIQRSEMLALLMIEPHIVSRGYCRCQFTSVLLGIWTERYSCTTDQNSSLNA